MLIPSGISGSKRESIDLGAVLVPGEQFCNVLWLLKNSSALYCEKFVLESGTGSASGKKLKASRAQTRVEKRPGHSQKAGHK